MAKARAADSLVAVVVRSGICDNHLWWWASAAPST